MGRLLVAFRQKRYYFSARPSPHYSQESSVGLCWATQTQGTMPQKAVCATCQHLDVRKEQTAGIPAGRVGRARINLPLDECRLRNDRHTSPSWGVLGLLEERLLGCGRAKGRALY